MSILLGCIADDFTGATDLAGLLRRSGVSVRLHLGVPDIGPDDYDAAPFEIIALKCRTTPAQEAVDEVLAAWRWLSANGARRAYWKYCSTFDSTADGNIGPVADALMNAMSTESAATHERADITVHCPSFPENGRRVFMGNLFVFDQPLHESPMKDHPLTPMRDSDLARLLRAQTPHPVGKLTTPDIVKEREDVRARIDELADDGVRHIIGDATEDMHLVSIARATEHLRLLCGGSAFASHLPALFRVRGFLSSDDQVALAAAPEGDALVISGSCSAMSQRQVAAWPAPSLALDPMELARDDDLAATRARFTEARERASAEGQPLLVYTTANPESVRQAQQEIDDAGALVERALATLAAEAVAQGVRRVVVAGGETSGAVSKALGVVQLDVGHEIVPGVPWCRAETAIVPGEPIAITLKSGNFGGEHFFAEALDNINPPVDEDA